MNKYYTPSIEEFHVGFRYEYIGQGSMLDGNGDNWVKEKYDGGCGMDGESEQYDVFNKIIDKKARVKYLDKENIEELGWKYSTNAHRGIDTYGFGDRDSPTRMRVHKDSTRVEIWEIKPNIQNEYKFLGYVKNYNELKRIMKQVGIC